MTLSHCLRRLALVLLSAVLAIYCSLMASHNLSTAHAQSPELSDSSALVDPTAAASLRIHKHEGDPLTQYGDPTNSLAPKSRAPIEGIRFVIRKINVDLSTTEGWRELRRYATSDFFPGERAEHLLGPERSALTDDRGIATFSPLDVGAYFVTEEATSASDRQLSVVDPFVVTVPSTVDFVKWNYHVEVYAKDQKIRAHKSANRESADLGDEVVFGIGSTTPAPDSRGQISRFEIIDPLHPALEYIPGSDLVFLSRDRDDDKPIQLEAQVDFTVSEIAPHTLQMSLTDSGLKQLARVRDGKPTVSVNWYFNVKVIARPDNNLIPNRGYILPPGYPQWEEPSRPGVPTNEVIIEIPNPDPHPPSNPPGVPIVPIPIPVPPPGTNPPGFAGPPPPPKTTLQKISNGLADTGADVWAVAALGLALCLAGLVLARRQRDEA